MEVKSNPTQKVWITSIVLAVLGLVAFFVVRAKNPDLALNKSVGWLIGFLAVIGIGMLVYYAFFRKETASPERSEALPPAITFVQARNIAIQQLRDPLYLDDIDMNHIEVEKPQAIGSPPSQVYLLVCKGKKVKSNRYAIAVNMHYPEKMRGMLVNPSDTAIRHMVNGLAVHPEPEPEKEQIVRRNHLLGTEEVIDRPVSKDSEPEKKEDPIDK